MELPLEVVQFPQINTASVMNYDCEYSVHSISKLKFQDNETDVVTLTRAIWTILTCMTLAHRPEAQPFPLDSSDQLDTHLRLLSGHQREWQCQHLQTLNVDHNTFYFKVPKSGGLT